MAKMFSKQVSSFAFRLQKTYDRLLTFKPSWFVIAIFAVAASIFLLAGGIYNMIIQESPYVFASDRLYIFYPSSSRQFALEPILTSIFYAIGFAGFLVAYRSTKYAYNPRNAYRFLLVGIVLLIIGILLAETGLNIKFGL